MPPPTVLVVEDDPVILLSTKARTDDLPLDLVDRVHALLSR